MDYSNNDVSKSRIPRHPTPTSSREDVGIGVVECGLSSLGLLRPRFAVGESELSRYYIHLFIMYSFQSDIYTTR